MIILGYAAVLVGVCAFGMMCYCWYCRDAGLAFINAGLCLFNALIAWANLS